MVISMAASLFAFIVAAVISGLSLHNYEWGRVVITLIVPPDTRSLFDPLRPLHSMCSLFS